MRLTLKDARSLGIIDAATEKSINKEIVAAKNKRSILIKQALNERGEKNPPNYLHDDSQPQAIIFNELNRRVMDIAMYEVGGLVPGRKYRADIYLPKSRLVIEMDGFQHHRSKDQFQKDREKRAQLLMRGYPVFAVYYGQVKNQLFELIDDILEAHEFYLPFAEAFFQRQLEMAVQKERGVKSKKDQ